MFLSIFYIKKEHQELGKYVVINEVCYNFSVSEQEDGANYIELYNPTEEILNLSGYYLANNTNAVDSVEIEPISIPAKGYKNVYIDDNWEGMDFSVSEDVSGAELFSLFLFDSEGKIVDTVDVPQIKYDTSWARITDGEAGWENLEATPEDSNKNAGLVIRETLSAPSFSVESGFFTSDFELELGTLEGDCNIYYTLDGSIPDEQSMLYTEPIHIYNPSDEPNRYASLENFSAGYNMEDYDLGKVTTENIPKCMVVRSIAYNKDGTKKSKVESKTYFVCDAEEYTDLPLVSLIGDPEDLFGYEKGIYVTGQTLDTYLSSTEADEESWGFWPANYRNKGKAWEREVHMEYFKEKKLVLEQEVGIRIKGGATRSYPQKSFNVYARNVYGQDVFTIPFFEGNKGQRRISLFSGANDVDTKIRDVLVHNLCSNLEFCTMKSIPCYVFLNGEYWGLYYITEKFDETYIQENYEVLATDVLMIKAGFPENGDRAYEEYESLLNFVETNDLSKEVNYSKIQDYIDMQSFMEYYATQIYLSRCNDWPSGNWAIWKSEEKKEEDSYYDGRWRWILFDLNWSNGGMTEDLLDFDVVQYVREKDALFDKLMENSQFRKEFAYVFSNVANINFEDERVQQEINILSSIVEKPVKQDYHRFYCGALSEESFEQGVNDIRIFFENRKSFIMEYVAEHCELTGTCEDICVGISNEEAGTIIINNAVVDMYNSDWQGRYYTDYPLTVQAIPKEGYVFAGWSGDVELSSETISLTIPSGGISLQAEFIER